MRKSCPYCAQTHTHKDQFGYCRVYSCFYKSGKKGIFDRLKKEASDIYFMPNTYGQIGRVVTNLYSHRSRKASDIFHKAQREFGFLPLEIYESVPMKNREKWDKNIMW